MTNCKEDIHANRLPFRAVVDGNGGDDVPRVGTEDENHPNVDGFCSSLDALEDADYKGFQRLFSMDLENPER